MNRKKPPAPRPDTLDRAYLAVPFVTLALALTPALVLSLSVYGCGKEKAPAPEAAAAASAAAAAADAKAALLRAISGVWNPSPDNSGLWTFNYVNNSLQIVIGDQFIAATPGDVDPVNGTVNLKIPSSDGAERIMTVSKVQDRNLEADGAGVIAQPRASSNGQINYYLTVTDSSGGVTPLLFVRRIGADDLDRIAQLQTQARIGTPSAALAINPANGDQTYATSFDCSKATSVPQYLICHDPELAAADRDLSAIYQKARDAVRNKAALADRARQQWNFREKNCRDKTCLLSWYQYESATFDAIAQTGDVNARPDQEQ